MKQFELFEPIPCDKYDLLTREDAITLAKGYEDAIRQLKDKLEEQNKKLLNSSSQNARHIFLVKNCSARRSRK